MFDQQNSISNIIDGFENETYLRNYFANTFKEVVSRIEEFSSWFNSVARLYSYKCGFEESEILLHLLLTLNTSLKDSILDIRSAARKVLPISEHYTCLCNEKIQIPSDQNVWKVLQDHSHVEENYSHIITNQYTAENFQSLEADVTEHSLNNSSLELTVPSMPFRPFQNKNFELNSFRFNFVINYDSKIQGQYYPSKVVRLARSIDHLPEITIQRVGIFRAMCLLCSCPLSEKPSRHTLTSYIIKKHVGGRKHLNNSVSYSRIETLRRYHDFWKGQEILYQAHQVHFIPEYLQTETCICYLCMVPQPYNEIIEHINGPTHKNALMNIFNCVGKKSNEFYLLDLQLQVYEIFLNNKAAYGQEIESWLPTSAMILLASKEVINEKAEIFKSEALSVYEEQNRIFQCCNSLENALVSIYPICKAYAFGSRISGLANKKSDLDVFIDLGDMYNGGKLQEPEHQQNFVKSAAKVFKSFKEFSCVFAVPSARTPIVRLHENISDLDCDISFRHGLGVENTKFLRFCIRLEPIMQPFVLLLKKWSACCDLNQYVSNYALTIMAVFYLQVRRHLPPIAVIRQYNSFQSPIVDGWETLSYDVPVEDILKDCIPSTGDNYELLYDFFVYFAEFDYANQVVCPLLGKTVPKFHFNEKPRINLPIEMKQYVENIQKPHVERFRGLSPFCVQDPFDLSHNLTKACQPAVVNLLKKYFILSSKFLEAV